MLDGLLDDARTEDEEPRSRRRRRTWPRRLAVSVLVLALLVVIGLGAYAWLLSDRVDDNLTREDLIGSGVVDGKQVDPDRTTTGEQLVSGRGTNYLLIGSDARPGETSSRADVIQLVHVDEGGGAVWMVHFPRDLYVDIPGHGKDKINAAYAFGESPLLVRTVQDLVGVKIDHVAKTDFEGFKQLTDAVGGVRVYATEASSETGNGNTTITEGYNDLDGEQALGFVRERYQLSEGDISRGERQQAWLRAIMDKTLDPAVLLNPRRLGKVIDAGTQNTVVDNGLTGGEIRRQALAMRGVRGDDIHFVTAPWDGFGTTSGGASIVNLDEAGMSRLSDALRSDDMASFTE